MAEMSDLELVRLCAEAMGLYLLPAYPKGHLLYNPNHDRGGFMWSGEIDGEGCYFIQSGAYDPLHDDAQAMALVKKMSLCISAPQSYEVSGPKWGVGQDHKLSTWGPDLNRAIVECVAKMQAAKRDAA